MDNCEFSILSEMEISTANQETLFLSKSIEERLPKKLEHD